VENVLNIWFYQFITYLANAQEFIHQSSKYSKQMKKQMQCDHRRRLIFVCVHVCPIPISFSSCFLLLKNANPLYLEIPAYLTFGAFP
jgi:hypothetical protein